jgi:hypothetical protein
MNRTITVSNCKVYYCRLNPDRPNATFDKENPRWEVQLRTHDANQKKEWEQFGMKPKLMIHKEGDQEGEPLLDEDGQKTWVMTLSKNSKNKKGEPSKPVPVLDYKLDHIDPDTIGNESICNIQVYQYEYTKPGTTEVKIASLLSGLQVVKHIVFKPKERQFFQKVEGQTIPLPIEEGIPDPMSDF